MKKTVSVLLLLVAFLFLHHAVHADGYDALWKRVEAEKKKDLPRSQIAALDVIITKAEKEKAYGHQLKAEFDKAALLVNLSPDSLQSVTAAIEKKAASYETSNYALYAIYNTVLGRMYNDRGSKSEAESKACFAKALAHPEQLAACKAPDYVPLVERGADSRYFNDDLLSLIGYEAGEYKLLNAYYDNAGNRRAAMFAALEMLRAERYATPGYKASLDSLIDLYADLTECGEVAIERYNAFADRHGDWADARAKIEYIDMALGKWGTWHNMNTLRNARKSIVNPGFTASMNREVVFCGVRARVDVTVKNIGSLTMNVSRLSIAGNTKLTPDNPNDLKKIKSTIVARNVASRTLTFKGKAEYETVADSIFVENLTPGVYLLEFTADNKALKPRYSLLHVTNLYVVGQHLPGKTIRFAVLNAATGQPVPGAKIYLRDNDGKERTLTCGANGEVMYDNTYDRGLYIRPFTAADNASPVTSHWGHFSYYADRNDNDIVNLYTDRGIYRPGQTVHVSAIAFNNKRGVELKAIAGRKFSIALRDANHKVVAEKEVTTDEYGNAATDFVLPANTLTGRFSLISDLGQGGYASIRVEYYKRPAFRVEFDPVEQSYARGDTVTLKGRATTYSGVPVQGARVEYNVTRRQSLWGRSRFDASGAAELDKGATVTGSDGTFEVRMPMVLPATYDDNEDDMPLYRIARYYNIIAHADVTDAGGETHACEMSLTIGSKPVSIYCDMPDMMERDSIKAVTFEVRNASGTRIPGKVTYYIDNPSDSFTANANEPVMLQWGGSGAVSGRHRLVAVCQGDTISREFIVFGMDDKRPVYTTHKWFHTSSTQFPRDGKPVYVQVGSSDKDVHVLYTVISEDKLLESGTFDLSDSIYTRKFGYRNEYGKGLLLNYVWVKDGETYAYSTYIERPMPDKRLSLKWTTFRDKLKPGQTETWSVSITRPDGKPADARLLATMYDASLEQLSPFNWFFNTYMRQNRPNTQWSGLNFNSLYTSCSMPYKLLAAGPLRFSHISFSGLYAPRDEFYTEALSVGLAGKYMKMRAAGNMLMSKEEAKADHAVPNAAVMEKHSAVTEESADAGAVMDDAAPESEAVMDNGSMRENFNETAFFYPALATDADGNVNISFTLPESVTTWRFMGLAHDRDLNNGLIHGDAVAEKEFMVQPNVPRFVRVGDKAVLSTRLFNTSDKAVSGTLYISIINPETGKTVLTRSRKFNVAAGETAGEAFDADFSGFDATIYIYKVYADGKTFSDGEQHYLPVLPDKEMVTNTMPFTQNGPQTTTVDLGKLASGNMGKKGMINGKLTIEYTNNPAWLMLQALPYVGSANEENAVSLAAAYYANGVGAYIVDHSPKLKTTFAQWQAEQGRQTSLSSALQGNEELKNIALDETPWVTEAADEAGQKQAVANFFDGNTLQYNAAKMLAAMGRLQNADGSFSWWKGMQGSLYMTAEVAEYLTRLNVLTSRRSATATMLNRAYGFIGGEMIKEVKELKRREKAGSQVYLSGMALRYLYINAISGRTLPAAEKEASDYLIKLIGKQKLSQDLYGKALAAVVLSKNGNKATAAEYVKSLKEYTVYKEETGRYYDTPRAGYSWRDYRIPTQTAVIEAMQEITPEDAVTINEMKRWLLQSKRTQAWDTPVSSVNAVYAFMRGADNVLGNKELSVMKVDGKQVEMPEATAGIGYVKTTVPAAGTRQVSVTKTSDGTSWGGVYVQYMQPVGEIADAAAGLSVKREILASGDAELKTGDRVKVRITIRADRDFDFVQVADKRAACMEPVGQLSGYSRGYYTAPKDNSTCYYFDRMRKGTHVIDTEYYIDRAGTYETGTCTVQCAYSPEYMARTKSQTIKVKP